jgi:predicted RNA-binding protein
MQSIRKMSVVLLYKNGDKIKYTDVDAMYSAFETGRGEILHLRLPEDKISIEINELESFVTCD